MDKIFKGKKVLVTGGAGSIGEAIIRELLKYGPDTVRVLDIDETRQFELMQRLKAKNLRFLIGDVRDKERMARAMKGIDIVFHCAAMKHVWACEYNPFESVKTNVMGIQNLIDVAIDEGVERFVFTSSDKAVNPRNVMGTTKLLGEKLVTSANYYRGTKPSIFTTVRFGNVIGSRGSVIPLFAEQIRQGGPVTITDPNMTRFTMSLGSAVSLLFKATEMAQGGEVFIMKMPAMRVSDIADVMISNLAPKCGYKPEQIKTKTTGAAAGEKMHEELMTSDEASRALETEDLFIVLPEVYHELAAPDASKYHAKPAKGKCYCSNDVPAMPKEKMAELLRKENLL